MSAFDSSALNGMSSASAFSEDVSSHSANENFESESDETDVEDIPPFPTQVRTLKFVVQPGGRKTDAGQLSGDLGASKQEASFRPQLDTPDNCRRSARLNPIPNQEGPHESEEANSRDDDHHSETSDSVLDFEENPRVGPKADIQTKSVGTGTREDCRLTKVVSIHIKSAGTPSGALASGPKSSTASQQKSDTNDFKVKKATDKNTNRKRRGTVPLSKGAKDSRQRRAIEEQYQKRLEELLDEDIRQQVEQEGGITPIGRLFKAGVRMMERVSEERKNRNVASEQEDKDEDEDEDKERSDAELESMRQRALRAEQKVQDFTAALQILQALVRPQ